MTSQNDKFPPLFKADDNDWKNNARILPEHYRGEFYIVGYKKAADNLVAHVISTGCDQDTLIYPIAFLYRHYLELLFKNIIENGYKLLNRKNEYPKNHYLDTLWTNAKDIINEIWEEEENSKEEEIEHFIAEFIKIDKSSQAFRYTKDKKGNEYLTEVELINIRHLSVCINSISDHLEGISAYITESLSASTEYSNYML
jgi:hypothetical protein